MVIPDGSLITAKKVLKGLRLGLVHTHLVDQVGLSGTAPLVLDLQIRRLRDYQSHSIVELKPAGRIRRMHIVCDLLDRLGIPNGTKAIDIALAEHWSEDYRQVYGEHESPSTIKRWRIERHQISRRRSEGQAERDRRGTTEVLCKLRARHAAHTVCNRKSARKGYQAAMAELSAINSGHHPLHPRPEPELPRFSYGTFLKDCKAIASRVGLQAWPTRRRCRSLPPKRRAAPIDRTAKP